MLFSSGFDEDRSLQSPFSRPVNGFCLPDQIQGSRQRRQIGIDPAVGSGDMTVADDFGLALGDSVSDLKVSAPYHRRLAPIPAVIVVFVLVEAFVHFDIIIVAAWFKRALRAAAPIMANAPIAAHNPFSYGQL